VTEDLEELALLDSLGLTQHIEPPESAPPSGAAHDHSNSIAVPRSSPAVTRAEPPSRASHTNMGSRASLEINSFFETRG
jgi:hypothetical protein